MHDGRIEVSGTSQFLATDKRARQIYLGERFTLV
jgi:ABC-type lipopolysaccharide export system ATPase subunit